MGGNSRPARTALLQPTPIYPQATNGRARVHACQKNSRAAGATARPKAGVQRAARNDRSAFLPPGGRPRSEINHEIGCPIHRDSAMSGIDKACTSNPCRCLFLPLQLPVLAVVVVCSCSHPERSEGPRRISHQPTAHPFLPQNSSRCPCFCFPPALAPALALKSMSSVSIRGILFWIGVHRCQRR
jgi:hypothetical protein